MKRARVEKLKQEVQQWHRGDYGMSMPQSMDDGRRVVNVFVEGYEDVAFWRGIFDHFDNPFLRFEISVPNREDLPKGTTHSPRSLKQPLQLSRLWHPKTTAP